MAGSGGIIAAVTAVVLVIVTSVFSGGTGSVVMVCAATGVVLGSVGLLDSAPHRLM